MNASPIIMLLGGAIISKTIKNLGTEKDTFSTEEVEKAGATAVLELFKEFAEKELEESKKTADNSEG